MIRILHTADVHLDSPLKSLALRDEGLQSTVHTATRTAFTRLVDFALAEDVSALLIAGDLFDGAERSAKTAAFLTGQLDRLKEAGIPVFYIKGNHDAENPLTGEVSLPENVHVFDGRGGREQLGETDVWIHGVSFSGRQAPDSLSPKLGSPEIKLEEAALSYLETAFGLRLAEEAIRRYRDSHRSSMMEATEKAFADLTNGAYARLQTRPEGSSEILQAIDASGTAKQASDLSKGTRFQLFLALRAAAYEQLASQGVCLLFFCDDIFETFDEERTRSACKVMETIGRTGQVIYLTHHRHVVDIAREVCGDGVAVLEL